MDERRMMIPTQRRNAAWSVPQAKSTPPHRGGTSAARSTNRKSPPPRRIFNLERQMLQFGRRWNGPLRRLPQRRWKNAVVRPGAQHMMGSGGSCRIARPRPSADHAELSARWDGRAGRLDQVRSVSETMRPEEKQPCRRHQHTTAVRCGSSRGETCAAEDSGSGVQHWTASPLVGVLPAIYPTDRAMMRSSDEANPHRPGSFCRAPGPFRRRPTDSPHQRMPRTVTDGQRWGRHM